MKAECIFDKISGATQRIARIAQKNPHLPVLESVLLVVSKNEVLLRATNLHVGAEIKIPAKTTGDDWSVAVSANVLSSLFQNIKDQEKVVLEKVGNILKISTGQIRSEAKTLPVDDFPSIPEPQDGQTFSFGMKKFRDAVGQVAYAASNTDARPEISSVYIYGEGDGLVLVSTDSYRLSEKKIQLDNSDGFPAIILPIKNVHDIVSFFQNTDEDIDVIVTESQISFLHNNVYFTSRIYEGAFPDYKQIIPSGETLSATFLKSDLADLLRIVNVFSDPFHKITITMDPSDKKCSFHSKNADTGEVSSDVPVVFSGKSNETITATINHGYLSDFIKASHSDSVTIDLVSAQKPLIATNVGDESLIYLIMPMNR